MLKISGLPAQVIYFDLFSILCCLLCIPLLCTTSASQLDSNIPGECPWEKVLLHNDKPLRQNPAVSGGLETPVWAGVGMREASGRGWPHQASTVLPTVRGAPPGALQAPVVLLYSGCERFTGAVPHCCLLHPKVKHVLQNLSCFLPPGGSMGFEVLGALLFYSITPMSNVNWTKMFASFNTCYVQVWEEQSQSLGRGVFLGSQGEQICVKLWWEFWNSVDLPVNKKIQINNEWLLLFSVSKTCMW